jgi:hypothetical protein
VAERVGEEPQGLFPELSESRICRRDAFENNTSSSPAGKIITVRTVVVNGCVGFRSAYFGLCYKRKTIKEEDELKVKVKL